MPYFSRGKESEMREKRRGVSISEKYKTRNTQRQREFAQESDQKAKLGQNTLTQTRKINKKRQPVLTRTLKKPVVSIYG
jgi:hypothetical protein